MQTIHRGEELTETLVSTRPSRLRGRDSYESDENEWKSSIYNRAFTITMVA